MSKLATNSFILISGRGVGFLISAILPIVLVRLFSVAEFGEYRQIVLIITTCATILPFGMQNSLYYFMPKFPDRKAEFITRTFAFICIVGLIFIVLILIFFQELASFFGNPSFVIYGKLAGVIVVMLAISSLIETVLIIEEKVSLSSKMLVLTRLLRAVIILFGALQEDIILILYGLFILYFFKAIFSLIYLVRSYEIPFYINIFSGAVSHLKYGTQLGISGVFVLLSEVTDKFMVSHYLEVEVFAIYMIGCYELPLISIIFGSIGDVVLPRVVETLKINNKKDAIRLWHSSIEKSMLIGLPIFTFFFSFANLIVLTFFTDKYADAVPVFRIGLLAVILESTRYGMITRAYARTKFMLKVSLLSYFIMLPLCYLGIIYYGVLGAITAVMFSKIFMVSSELIMSKYLLSLSWSAVLPFRQIAHLSLMTLLCLILPAALLFFVTEMEITPWISIVAIFILFAASFVWLSNLFGHWRISHLPISESIKGKMAILFK